jgi:hypothetical protein
MTDAALGLAALGIILVACVAVGSEWIAWLEPQDLHEMGVRLG